MLFSKKINSMSGATPIGLALFLSSAFSLATELENGISDETIDTDPNAANATLVESMKAEAGADLNASNLQEAENIDLSQPVEPTPDPSPMPQTALPAPLINPEPKNTTEPSVPLAPTQKPLALLGKAIPKGTTTRLQWSPEQSFDGIATPTPVLIAHGVNPGPKLCLTAAVHGDELNGIEIVRRVSCLMLTWKSLTEPLSVCRL